MGAVVLFDGVCNFCNASVNWMIAHDAEGYFKFAPLQSDTGKALAKEHGLDSAVTRSSGTSGDAMPIDSVILIENSVAYTHSDAALRIARRLGPPWSVLYAFVVIPSGVRDIFYRLFARYRYRLFGRKDECMLPTAEVRERFLN
jgi:predicted DCC family thiol-disulfide oxidoreductase YuxK